MNSHELAKQFYFMEAISRKNNSRGKTQTAGEYSIILRING